MKTRKVDLEHTPLLTNHVFKHIILEAPTVSELEKKVKEYELTLIKAITNAYKLSHLALQKDCTFHISPTESYQASIMVTFNGKKKEEITNPKKTLDYVKKLTSLESKKQHESNIIIPSKSLTKESSHIDTIVIEVDDKSQIDEKISTKQKELLEGLIAKTNLTEISFLPTAKHQDSNTGKITITVTVNYKFREMPTKKIEHTYSEESGNR